MRSHLSILALGLAILPQNLFAHERAACEGIAPTEIQNYCREADDKCSMFFVAQSANLSDLEARDPIVQAPDYVQALKDRAEEIRATADQMNIPAEHLVGALLTASVKISPCGSALTQTEAARDAGLDTGVRDNGLGTGVVRSGGVDTGVVRNGGADTGVAQDIRQGGVDTGVVRNSGADTGVAQDIRQGGVDTGVVRNGGVNTGVEQELRQDGVNTGVARSAPITDLLASGDLEARANACDMGNLGRLGSSGLRQAEAKFASIIGETERSLSELTQAVRSGQDILLAAALLRRNQDLFAAEGMTIENGLYDLPTAVTLYFMGDIEAVAKRVGARHSKHAQPNSWGYYAFCNERLIQEILAQ